MTTVRVVPRPRIRPRARSSRSPVPFPRARARATVGARASTKSRDGDTSTGHDSSLSSIIIHQPSSIPPLSVDCIKITGRDPSRCPDRLASRVMSSSDRLDSTRLDSIDSTRLDRLDRLDSIDRSTDVPDRRVDGRDASTRSSAPGGRGERARRSVRAFVASVVRRVASVVGRRVVASSRRRVVASSRRRRPPFVRSLVRAPAGRDGTGRDGTGG